jgi:hypothetical protein
MTFDEIVGAVSFWLDAVPADTAPQRAAELLDRYLTGAHSPSADVTARDFARVATHEASHAAVAFAAGLSPEFAVINADGSGAVRYSRDDVAVDRIMWTICTDLAGIVGELFADSGNAGRRWALANSFDIHQARAGIDAARKAAPSWNLPTKTFVQVSLSAVYGRWNAIEAISRVLRERREIEAAEIDALCGLQ